MTSRPKLTSYLKITNDSKLIDKTRPEKVITFSNQPIQHADEEFESLTKVKKFQRLLDKLLANTFTNLT